MDGYIENVEFCEYCGSFLDSDGRCPDPECVHNLLMDVLGELEDTEPVEEDTPVEEVEPTKEDAETTDDNSEIKPVDDEDEKGAE